MMESKSTRLSEQIKFGIDSLNEKSNELHKINTLEELIDFAQSTNKIIKETKKAIYQLPFSSEDSGVVSSASNAMRALARAENAITLAYKKLTSKQSGIKEEYLTTFKELNAIKDKALREIELAKSTEVLEEKYGNVLTSIMKIKTQEGEPLHNYKKLITDQLMETALKKEEYLKGNDEQLNNINKKTYHTHLANYSQADQELLLQNIKLILNNYLGQTNRYKQDKTILGSFANKIQEIYTYLITSSDNTLKKIEIFFDKVMHEAKKEITSSLLSFSSLFKLAITSLKSISPLIKKDNSKKPMEIELLVSSNSAEAVKEERYLKAKYQDQKTHVGTGILKDNTNEEKTEQPQRLK